MKNKIEFEITCLPEDISIEGNVLASGNADEDKEAEQKVIDQLNSGNDWAWCCVRVKATMPGYSNAEGTDYLGGCSYRSQRDFEQGGYFEDMKARAAEELLNEIKRIEARKLRDTISNLLNLKQFEKCMFKHHAEFAFMAKKVSKSKKVRAACEELLKLTRGAS